MKTITVMLWFIFPLCIYAQEKDADVDITTSEFERVEIVKMHPGTE